MNTMIIRFFLNFRPQKVVPLLSLVWLAASTEAIAQNFWQQTNWPNGGSVFAFAILSNGHILAGTGGAGIFRSADNGNTWSYVNTNTPNLSITVFAIKDNTKIFAGTVNHGVFRSIDNGNTWMQSNSGLMSTYITALAAHPSGRIYAGTIDRGVYQSTDEGSSWISVSNGLPNTNIQALVVNKDGDIFVGTSGEGVFRLANNEDRWVPVNTGLTDRSILVLAINADGDIFAGTGSSGVYHSITKGQNWVAVNAGLTNPSIRSLAIDANGNIFAGTERSGIFRLPSNGSTWTPFNNGLTKMTVWSLAFDVSGYIFAGSLNYGIFRTTKEIDNWMPINNGLTALGVVPLINSNGIIFANTVFGLFRSTDNGLTWMPLGNEGLTNPGITSLAINSRGTIFVGTSYDGTNYGGVFRSTDNGESWEHANTGLTSVTVLSLAINSKDTIFAGTVTGVFRSIDNGDTWEQLTTELSDKSVQVLAVNSSDHIFAGAWQGGVFRSTNHGDTWTQLSDGLTSTLIYSLVINPRGPIFVGTQLAGVFRSFNNGTTWASVNTGLSNQLAFSLAINHLDHVFVGTAGGVFRSTNHGDTWIEINQGLTHTFVGALAVTSNGYILASTNGGLFRSVESTTSAAPVVTTLAASNIGLTYATLHGIVNPNDRVTEVRFQYGVSTNYGNSVLALPNSVSGLNTVSIQANITELSPNTTYHFRVVASSSAGTAYGADQTVQTSTANRRPIVSDPIPDQTLWVGGPFFTQDLNEPPTVFNDSDGDVLTYSATSSDTNIAKASLSNQILLVVTPMAVGSAIIKVTAKDDKGDSASTTFRVTVKPPPTLTIPDTSALPNVSFEVPIQISDATGIAGAAIKITFDANILTAIDAQKTSLTSDFLLADTISFGEIKLGLARATGIAGGSGDLVILTFRVNPSATPGDTTTLVFAKLFLFDENTNPIPANGVNGLFTVKQPRDTTAPTAPLNLQAAASDRKVTLTWTANTESDLLRYRIYRNTSSPASTIIDSVAAGAATYMDTNVINGTTYFYRITAVDTALNVSVFSNEAYATPRTNNAPEVRNALQDTTLVVGCGNFVRDLNVPLPVFTDKDGDTLIYSANSSNESVAKVSINKSSLNIIPVNAGIAEITVTANDGKGGEIWTKFWVTVLEASCDGITVSPNPFTPNDDGFNDDVSFKFSRRYIQRPEVLIFNIAGKRVKSLSTTNAGILKWHGVDDGGQALAPGVYIYVIKSNGQNISSGTITLMR